MVSVVRIAQRSSRLSIMFCLACENVEGAWYDLALEITQVSPKILATSIPGREQVTYLFLLKDNQVCLPFLVSLVLTCVHKDLCAPSNNKPTI